MPNKAIEGTQKVDAESSGTQLSEITGADYGGV